MDKWPRNQTETESNHDLQFIHKTGINFLREEDNALINNSQMQPVRLSTDMGVYTPTTNRNIDKEREARCRSSQDIEKMKKNFSGTQA